MKKAKLEEIKALIESNEEVRGELIKILARDFPSEYLKPVKILSEQTGDRKITSMVASDKEWQE